jgi:MFS-type transporter involved in bile tolerance (Atg22 family)
VTDLTSPRRGAVVAWGFWDWAFSAFNAVATTFVYLGIPGAPKGAYTQAG